MTDSPAVLSPAEVLRQSFDQSFAAPPAVGVTQPETFLAIRLDGDGFAIRLGEIDGLEAGKAVRPLPLDRPAFLGIAGLRGRLVPVFSLARFLGHAEESRDRHWIVLIGRDQPVGLTFSAFEGHLWSPGGDISAVGETAAGPDNTRPYVRQVLRQAGTPRPILDIPRITAAIRGG